MDHESVTCQIRVSWPRDDVPGLYTRRRLRDVEGSPKVTGSLRQRWTEEIVKSFASNPDLAMTIRPWDIDLNQDGSSTLVSWSEKESRSFYPSRCRIPPHNILGVDEEEKIKRAERFALGSLLYEVMTAKEPFEDLSDDEVQENYSRGIFPDDVFSMAMGPYILGCWSLEFEKEMKRLIVEASRRPMSDRFRAYARAHPYLLASQILGGVAVTASVAVVPVLGLAGFAGGGPVAASAAAAWQSSIGIVQAGSLFSFCQSAAMGGTAVNGIIACGAAGGSVAMAATGAAVAGGQTALTPERMKEMFLKLYRKENSEVELMPTRL